MSTGRQGAVKRTFASMALACFVLFGVLFGFFRYVLAASPVNFVNYQGRLLNANGVPVADATASITFAFYTAVTGGSCVWSNSSATCASTTARTVTLSDGLFSENLGDTTIASPYASISDSVFTDNAAIFLEVIVNGETLTPRKRIVSAPYALNASALDGFNSTQTGGTSALVPVLDASGNLQLTGSPQGTAITQGSVYINPAAGVVAADEIVFGVAVGASARFSVDGEGDVAIVGDTTITGGDLVATTATFNLLNATTTTLNFASAATTLNIADAAITGTIDIGGVTSSGTTSVNIATEGTAADTIIIGNSNASTLMTLTGGDDWSITSGGLITTAGDVAVNGNDITSTGILRLTSGGAAGLQFDSANGIVNVAASDDFVVGGTTLVSPFSVDESLNTVRIGDGTSDANDPMITFYASDAADSGSLLYLDADVFSFSAGDFLHTGTGTLPAVASSTATSTLSNSTFTGTSDASLSAITMRGLSGVVLYSAVENATGTDHFVEGSAGALTISGSSATITRGFGMRGSLTNSSTNASLVQAGGYLSALEGSFTQDASATTVAEGMGVHGIVSSTNGTITSGYGVYGEVGTSGGTITTGYAGRFVATAAGTTRYGVYGEASGGATANISGYFTGARFQIDGDSTPDTPGFATGAGDLYVTDGAEIDGGVDIGDATGTDYLNVTSAATTTTVLALTANSLTSGTGMTISRAAGGSDFDGTLLSLSQLNTAGTSDADGIAITNSGAGNAVGLYITMNTLSAQAANATGNNGLVIDVNEASGSENVIIIRSDADGTPDSEFRVESDGDVFGDGAAYVAGADYAEFFKTSDQSLGDYEVVCQDPLVSDAVRTCAAGDTRYVMGVVSTNAAFVGNNVGEDLNNDRNYRKIGMVGQIATFVTADEGAISIGDPITTSATIAGYGAKSHGPTRIVGFALESLASGTGTIRVLVQPQWYGGDVLSSDGSAVVAGANVVLAPMRTATATTSGDSRDLVLRGSGWNGAAAVEKTMSLRNDVTDGTDSYRLSVVNDAGTQVASVGNTGDLAIAGKLYPSDRGTLQTSKYMYYDGSSGAGGDMMRTNASGWGSGSYDFAEMFPSTELLAAGEVVVFADTNETIRRSTGVTYDDRIAGVVSTRPGFLAGDNRPGDVPVALAGRVPTYVSGENGAIAVGDPLTTSSKSGYAMKATVPGPIVGYAMEPFSGVTGVVVTFIRPSYFDGSTEEAPIAENSASDISSVATLDVSGSMNMNGGSIISVAALMGIGNNWRMLESGDFVTRGSIVALIRSFNGEDVETYAALGREHTVQLSGTATLRNGMVKIEFEKVDPAFNDIIANEVTYRVFVTPAGTTGSVYVAERSLEGFTVRDTENTSGVMVDWLVIAYHKDFAPVMVTPDVLAPTEEAESIPEVPIADEEIVDEVADADVPVDVIETTDADDVTVDTVVDEQVVPAEEPVADTVVVDEPVEAPSVTADTTEGTIPTPEEAL